MIYFIILALALNLWNNPDGWRELLVYTLAAVFGLVMCQLLLPQAKPIQPRRPPLTLHDQALANLLALDQLPDLPPITHSTHRRLREPCMQTDEALAD